MMNIIRKMDWDSMVHEYDLDGSRLLPWEGLNTPFGGAWCIVRPETKSFRHSHNEYELFIVIQGNAIIRINDEDFPVTKGDLIIIPLDSEHHVINNNQEDFHFYTIWWDKESTLNFLTRLEQD
ncbi:cupin domain-containing protein [Photorhabdus laumondii subsp. laumondii]|uniref:Photorhabdus luminescens subsp. laumondii TTO1 complete genome segment 15/17 n=3 Tax=Photorhabdus laumondii subsp. laumondii TaxID=141679 RepID=Q7MZL9_PHOLL|nr:MULTISPECIES: cupin domain-containing protein [Photorhabdus]AWK43829.1 cupin [Photorhabdus laumondii subsp. laumondii]AXG44506.1 cupin domain-containing protein [Photorhabdus laumondii subsp. laumondii]AXG49134.1 cupin domain-containing protein [Photorhabdus laumondii subsp. laumondii]KTL62076.1 cupin [Photorhabdus laumondii subsp. laumondii]MCC8384442.1 cupin domain-containing protein [Photorhabdus laumondii]